MIQNLLSTTISYIYKNSQRIFAVVGMLTIGLVFLYAIWKAAEFIITQPSFSFDPLVATTMLILGIMVVNQQAEHNKIMRTQNLILADLVEKRKNTIKQK